MDERGAVQVIFTVDTFTRASLGGGLLRHIKYGNAMRAQGIQFRWLTIESDVDEVFQERYGVQVQVVSMPAELPLQRKREWLLREALREATALPAGSRVVTTDSCGISASTIWQLWRARLRGIPATHNTSMVPGPLPQSRAGDLRLRLACKAFFGAHALVIPQTKAIERFFHDYAGVPQTKIQVIGNGVDCDRFAPPDLEVKRAARARLGLSADAPVVLSVGSVIPRKGMDLLVKSWPQVLQTFPQAKLVIAGSVGRRTTFMDKAATLDAYTAEVMAMIDALPDPGSVILSGREVEEVTDYYQAADMFAFASEREGLPNVVLEAMACGLPCLLAPFDGFPLPGEEFGFPDQHFVPCEHSPASIAAGIAGLLDSESKRIKLGKQARQQMILEQSLPMVLNHWARTYRRAALSWSARVPLPRS